MSMSYFCVHDIPKYQPGGGVVVAFSSHMRNLGKISAVCTFAFVVVVKWRSARTHQFHSLTKLGSVHSGLVN